MSRKNPNRKINKLEKLYLNVDPDESDETEWYLETPDLRLTKVFSVILILHIIAVGGILSFKMLNRVAEPGEALAQGTTQLESTDILQKELAGRLESNGNVELPTVSTGNTNRIYTVIAGDTLSEIAHKMGISVDALRNENGITEPDQIFVGMNLILPNAAEVTPSAPAEYDSLPSHPIAFSDENNESALVDVVSPSPLAQGVVYQVQKGDTAWSIAQKFGITHQELLKENGISHPEALQSGKLINIPGR